MNQKKLNRTDAESIASNSLKISFAQRSRHHSESNELTYNAYSNMLNMPTDLDNSDSGYIENRLNNLNKLASSAPNDSGWFFNDHENFSIDSTLNEKDDKSPIIFSDFSDQSDDDDGKSSLKSLKKSSNSFLKLNRLKRLSSKDTATPNEKQLLSATKSNYLAIPYSNKQQQQQSNLSSSVGNIDTQITSTNQSRRSSRKLKNSIRKRKRCYSMDEKRHLRNSLDSPFSFDNLAYSNKENLSDISEPLSSSSERNEKSNEHLKSEQQQPQDQLNKKPLPTILINSQLEYERVVKFDLTDASNDEDKNEDKDYLIKNEFRSSIDIELGSNESDEDLPDKNSSNTIEFTTKLASDLSKPEITAESLVSFMFQVLFPLLVCGLGNLMAGILLHNIESYDVFKEINELYIAIPCLMGLKGNLEMTMASRLSTAVSCIHVGIF